MTRLFIDLDDTDNALELPAATRERWQPIRGGILNLYLYDYEEFRYQNGHLILRGNNGTGKSRVMALQLPFLLDGHLISNRVEPDADPSKRMEWNLLMGRHDERLGYTWIEFGRRLSCGVNGEIIGNGHAPSINGRNGHDGSRQTDQQFVTLGCGLSATKGSGMRDPWFFITNQRIGEDLYLQTEAGHPLSKSGLIDAIADRGTVYTTAKEYRQAVDESLFGLGKQRYDALVELLIQLRRPQLSRQLDDKMLARVLGESLPPPSQQMILDVAESFRGLESDRRELDRFRSAHGSVESFLKTYRRYAQIAARRRAADVRQHHHKYEVASLDVREAEEEHADSLSQHKKAVAAVRALEIQSEEVESRIATLQSDPRMRGAEAIRQADEAAEQAQDDLKAAEREVVKAEERLDQRQAARNKVHENAERQLKKAFGVLQELTKIAFNCDLEKEHESKLSGLKLRLDLADAASGRDHLSMRSSIQGVIATKYRSCVQLKTLNDAVHQAERDLAGAKQTRDDVQGQVDEAIAAQKSADVARQHAVGDYVESYRMWRRESEDLDVPSADEIMDVIEDWSERVDSDSPIAIAVRKAELEARQALSDKRVQFQMQLDALATERSVAEQLAEKLEKGFHEPPPLPIHADAAARLARPGAPLWSLVDFAQSCADCERDCVEAALEAAGFLNAWVTLDGSVLTADFADVLISSAESPDVPDDRGLSAVLTPDRHRLDTSRDVSDGVIVEVLRKIGSGEQNSTTWISTDGRWRNGPLRGQSRKELPQYIGKDAREAHRARNLAKVRNDLGENESQAMLLKRQVQSIDARLSSVTRQVEAIPSDSGIRTAVNTATLAGNRVIEFREALTSTEQGVTRCRLSVGQSREIRDRDARDMGLIGWVDRLDTLTEGIAEYRTRLAELWPSIEHFESLKAEYLTAQSSFDEADGEAKLRRTKVHDMKTRHAKAREHASTLRKTTGVGTDEILRQVSEAEELRKKVKKELSEERTTETEAATSVARMEERIRQRRLTVSDESERRQQSCAALQRLCALGLLKIATPEFHDDSSSWSVSRTVEVARQTESSLSQVGADEGAWNRIQQLVTTQIQELNTSLSQHAFTSTLSAEDSLFRVTVPYQGRESSIHELAELLAEEVRQRQMILDEREREIIENHLIGEVAAKLHEQIREAYDLVDRMNAEIQKRPMSTGMMLKFDWKPDDELSGSMAEMCKKLLADTGTWSPSERSVIGQHLQEHIKEVRASREVGTWHEHLSEALDYRKWHRFWVMRKQDSTWKRLTKKTHGTGSGGEKAVALMIPQFAAAAAHYSSARSDAPRLILLDEAFVGIDPDMRGKCMELINVFDLDFLLTSEIEWGCYAGLPGVAIYQLSRRSGIEAVFLTRWIWNGAQRQRDETPLPPAARRVINGVDPS